MPASPATSAPTRALSAIADELARVEAEPASLSAVREASAVAAELLDEYLAEFGRRVTAGYDIRDRTLGDISEVILGSTWHSHDAESPDIVGDQVFGSLLAPIDELEHVSTSPFPSWSGCWKGASIYWPPRSAWATKNGLRGARWHRRSWLAP